MRSNHPQARGPGAISLYYERVYQRDDIGGVKLNDLQLDEFEWLLTAFKGSAFGAYRDEGMCDAMCKNVLGLALFRGRTADELDALNASRPDLFAAYDAPLDADLAVARQNHCVVGLQDDWPRAKRAIDHWFPWLTFVDDFRHNIGLGAKAETRTTLRPDIRAALERCNACDLALYEAAIDRHDAQHRLLDRIDGAAAA